MGGTDKLCLSVQEHLQSTLNKWNRKTIQHYNKPGHAHFLTFSCYKQLPLLNNERTRNWLIDAIEYTKEKYKYALWAYVIMPEHVHLLVYPLAQPYDISLFLKSIKQSVARKAKHFLQKSDTKWLDKLTLNRGPRKVFRFWQTGTGYDRNIKSGNELFEKFHYIHSNPVKRGLVLTPEEWLWSSARWYKGGKGISLAVDDSYFSKSFVDKL